MKKTNKILSVILAILMVISIIPITASAETPKSGTCGDDLTWTYDDMTYTLTISGTGAMDDYLTYNRPWEEYEDNIENIVVNDGVTTIGNEAFYHCEQVITVSLPNGVTTIGNGAFYYCGSLTNVIIPDSVITIGGWSFADCNSLTSITIPDSLKTIGNSAFYNTEYYNDTSNWENDVLYIGKHLIEAKYTISDSYIIKEGTKTISDYAFYNCNSLTSITIPDSVTIIGIFAFSECDSLASVVIGDNVTTIGAYAFSGCESITSVTIPESVITIGEKAFYYCRSLTSITIPDSVKTIDDSAFCGCDSLESVVIGDSVTTISVNAFSACTSLTTITIPKSVISIDKYAFYYCTILTDIYYTGTEIDWNAIIIGSYNNPLLDATIHYNYHVHKYNSVVTAPTCSEQGYTTYTCECGDSYVDDYVDVLGHMPTEPVQQWPANATCTENGSIYEVIYCAVCGEEIGRDLIIIEATGHADNDGDGYCDACNEQLEDNNDSQISIISIIMMIINFILGLFGIK